MKIADIHAHIFPEKLAEKASHSIGSFYGIPIEREADMPRLCAEDKLAGITRCAVSNSATNASQVRNANTFLAEAVRGHDGYLAFGTIYPGMDGFEEELDRMLELGLRGVKIHPDFQKLAIDDERGGCRNCGLWLHTSAAGAAGRGRWRICSRKASCTTHPPRSA